MNENKTSCSLNFSFSGLATLLFVVFLILKLCGVITWGWFYVFLPLIINASIVVLILLVWLVVWLIMSLRN